MRHHKRRMVRAGESYQIEDDVELEFVIPYPMPDVNVQGEPWGWTKVEDKPKGWVEGQVDYGPH